ncbi:MAG TPA: GIY-YIG nuclease family protein [bacterium]|nr:GIY-YIG nuclease family protein [bacterium]
MYYVYVLRSYKDGRFYTGYTADLKRRVEEHQSGISKSTSFRLPVELVYYESSLNIKDAMRREKYLKTTWGKRYIRNRIKEYLRDIKNIT